MRFSSPRRLLSVVVAVASLVLLHSLWRYRYVSTPVIVPPAPSLDDIQAASVWRQRKPDFPLTSLVPLPTAAPRRLPRLQHEPPREDAAARQTREQRRDAVQKVLARSWSAYRRRAWGADELAPVSGKRRTSFGGWAVTLIDSLDTLWLMGMRHEFLEAVQFLADVHFDSSGEAVISAFETNIRVLGGLLSAYDLSGEPLLLAKALEAGEMLYVAFDTPNHFPVTRWWWRSALNQLNGSAQSASMDVYLAELGSFSLEFTRLSQLTGDARWYDAVQRITLALEGQQNSTAIPGLWPQMINAKDELFNRSSTFSWGGMSDSMYEYLPKMHLLLGGTEPIYLQMYQAALQAAKQHLFFRPMTPDRADILFAGTAAGFGQDHPALQPSVQHLGCFIGGLVAIGAKLQDQPGDLALARKLTDGCVWAAQATHSGIMPEVFRAVPCPDLTRLCSWNATMWKEAVLDIEVANLTAVERARDSDEAFATLVDALLLPEGMAAISDRRYMLRPELVESLFVLYRTTADPELPDIAWRLFQAIENATRTKYAYASLVDVTDSSQGPIDRMETFWLAETLKYFYLLFSDFETLSLDDWVLNTEAHPFKRPVLVK